MSRSIDRLRARKESGYINDLDELLGVSSETVETAGKGVSTGVQALSEIWATQEKKKEEAKKKEDYEKSEAGQSIKAAGDARKAAVLAQADARAAQMLAASNPTEANKVAAQRATDAANVAEAAAAAAEAKAAYFKQPAGGGAPGSGQYGPTAPAASIFTTKNVLIGLGVLAGGFVVYKLASSAGSTKQYMQGGAK